MGVYEGGKEICFTRFWAMIERSPDSMGSIRLFHAAVGAKGA
jgi:hypothetical protein